jgi:crossover junction endodeoxyribonuclease RuvC
MLKILGFDPGLAAAGYGVLGSASGKLSLLDCGEIRTSSRDPLEKRLLKIYHGLGEIISQHNVDSVAVEQQIYCKNVKTALSLGQAQGMAMLAAAHADIAVRMYPPLEIKLAVAGSGKAGKEQVSRMVSVLLGCKVEELSEHSGDALAAAICHLHTTKTEDVYKNRRTRL